MNKTIVNDIQCENFRLYLQEELARRCSADRNYSLRNFAKDLAIDNSTLSKILSGKRVLGKRLMKKLISKLEIDFSDLAKLVESENDSDAIQYEQMAIDSFAIISDWHHYAILELLRVDHYKSEPKWMAKALGISLHECKAAIQRLMRVELVEKLADGTLIDVSGGKTTNISNDMKHGAFKKMQKQLLEKSIQAINSVPLEKRNNTSITMAIDTEKLPEAIAEITKFRRKMGKLLSRGDKRDQVYNLSIALCPLSEIEKK